MATAKELANTSAGTSNGATLVAPSSNSWINSLNDLSNVAGKVVGIYSSFLGTKATQKLEDEQKIAPPVQTPLPVSTDVNNAADFFANPALVKQAAIYALTGTFIVGAMVWVLRRS